MPKPEVERESEDFMHSLSLSLSQSAHYTFRLHAEFALTCRDKIIKDSCKTKERNLYSTGTLQRQGVLKVDVKHSRFMGLVSVLVWKGGHSSRRL